MQLDRYDVCVAERDEKAEKTYWHKVGVMFRSKDGNGFSIKIPPGVSVTGWINVFPAKPREQQAPARSGGQSSKSVGEPPWAGDAYDHRDDF